MAVDCGGHFLSGEQCNDFLLGGNELSGFGPLQRLANKVGKLFDLCTREELLNPGNNTHRLLEEWNVDLRLCWNSTVPFKVKLEVA